GGANPGYMLFSSMGPEEKRVRMACQAPSRGLSARDTRSIPRNENLGPQSRDPSRIEGPPRSAEPARHADRVALAPLSRARPSLGLAPEPARRQGHEPDRGPSDPDRRGGGQVLEVRVRGVGS